MISTETYHTIVIGARSGGMTAAVGLSALGHAVAFVEGGHVGGDCTNVGCVPSKTLIHLARHFGPGQHPDQVLRTVIRKRDALRDKETEEVRGLPNVTFIQGWASFLAPRLVLVRLPDGPPRRLSARHVVIATGSRPRWLEIPGLPAARALTNESLFDLREVPRHLAIAGAGVVGLEMAFAFRKLGIQVTLFTNGARPLPRAIPEASEAIRAALTRRGIAAHYAASAPRYDEATRTLIFVADHREVEVPGVDQVLFAVGRQRNLERLELERAGVRVDPRQGILVNAFGETSARGVYAIGDVTPSSAFTNPDLRARAEGMAIGLMIAAITVLAAGIGQPRRSPA